jgi:hypothetical protein
MIGVSVSSPYGSIFVTYFGDHSYVCSSPQMIINRCPYRVEIYVKTTEAGALWVDQPLSRSRRTDRPAYDDDSEATWSAKEKIERAAIVAVETALGLADTAERERLSTIDLLERQIAYAHERLAREDVELAEQRSRVEENKRDIAQLEERKADLQAKRGAR